MQGTYEDLSSMWYLDVGTQIILAMILEIGAPHGVPLMQYMHVSMRRCWDRNCSFDKSRSKKLLQQEYEDLYVGPEFRLDTRLAQIIAIVWVTFMYSSGLPIMFLIALVNFSIIYWIDKYLLLRFYKTPKNYSDVSIKFTISEMKWGIIFHFIFGALMYSNERILSSSGSASFLNNVKNAGGESLLSIKRYNSVHVLLFLAGGVILILLMIFESTILSLILSTFTCFKDLQKKFHDMEAISDDYYEVMTLKFLVSEFERTKQEKQRYLLHVESIRNDEDFMQKSQTLNKHIKRLKNKERDIVL